MTKDGSEEGRKPDSSRIIYMENAYNEKLIHSKQLVQDYEMPEFLAKYLHLQKVGMTIWSEFSREPKFNHFEKLVCAVTGTEKFRMVNAIFKQNMYSGVYEDLDPLETPINLFETDPQRISRYQLMKLKDVYEATL